MVIMPTADDRNAGLAPPSLADTLAARPELWDGPAWMLAVSRPNQAGALAVSGYRRQLADWEQHLEDMPSSGTPPALPASDLHVHDPVDLLRRRAWTSAELDIVIDTLDRQHLSTVVELIAGRETDAVMAAIDAPPVPVNANRRIDVADSLRGAVDLTVPTLPSRRDEATAPLAFGHRRLRLIAGPSWHIAAWGPLEGRWDPEVVRWPHFGIPSRTAGWRSGRFTQHQPPVGRLVGFMVDLCEHVEYQLGTWTTEHELWEQELFAALAVGPTTFEGVELERARQELSQFAEFLGLMRKAQRGLTRRPEIDAPLAPAPVRKVCHAAAERIGERLDVRRDRLREAFALLADIAAGEQAHAAEQQRAATERLQNTITVVTAALLVPALVVSIYGANLRELSVDARGDLPTLVALMVTSSALTTIALRASRSEPLVVRSSAGNTGLGVICTLCATIVATGLVTGRLKGTGWVVGLIGTATIAVSAILGLLTTRGKTWRQQRPTATGPRPRLADDHRTVEEHHEP
jgi:hypothetical protein